MMPPLTDLTGLFSIASVIAAIAASLPRIRHLPKKSLAIFTAVLFVAVLIPLNGLPLAAYARGMVGDLSITSVVLAWLILLQPYCATAGKKPSIPLWILIFFGALFLYPMTLGMSVYDPYRLGYGDITLVVIVLIIAIAAWWLQQTLIALCLALATLAWSLGCYESTNLWDYLLDPLVAVYAMSALLAKIFCRAPKQ